MVITSHPAAGHGALTVARCGGRSVVSRAYATSPLRLLTPSNHGHAAWTFTSSYGGGLVDGDHIALHIEVAAGAAAFVSSQASTKVYRSPRGTSTRTIAHVGPDGLLVLAPDPVVCFAGSRYRQAQEVDLQGGSLVLLDWLTSGRRAAGERWAFDEYHARLVVRREGTLLVHDALALRAGDGVIAARIGRFDVLATAVVIGPLVRAHAAGIVAAVSDAPIVRRADPLVSASALGDDGCVIRIAGRSVEQVGHVIRELLACLPALLGDDPWSRKW